MCCLFQGDIYTGYRRGHNASGFVPIFAHDLFLFFNNKHYMYNWKRLTDLQNLTESKCIQSHLLVYCYVSDTFILINISVMLNFQRYFILSLIFRSHYQFKGKNVFNYVFLSKYWLFDMFPLVAYMIQLQATHMCIYFCSDTKNLNEFTEIEIL